MPTFALFRFSTYLCLAISYIALAYAEWIFVPEATVIVLLLLGVIVLLYFFEDRVLLSIQGANILGGGLGIISSVWLVQHLLDPGSGLLESLHWSVRIMPFIGPVLTALITAKILRPGKHGGDYWAFHAGALCLIALASAMAEDGLFFTIVFIYLIATIWSLSLFFMMRSSAKVAPLPARAGEPIPLIHTTGLVAHPRRKEARLVFFSLLGSLVLAMPLFFVTPRTGGPVWDLAGRRYEVGYTADQLLDLNRVGTLQLNQEAAFEISVTDAQTKQPVGTLPSDMRWRSLSGAYTVYQKGTWKRDDLLPRSVGARNGFLDRASTMPSGPWQPPSFGPGTLRIQFSVPSQLRGLFLADPVQWDRNAPAPVAWIQPEGALPWSIRPDGRVTAFAPNRPQRFMATYEQVIRPETYRQVGPSLVPPWKTSHLIPGGDGLVPPELAAEYARQLRENPVPSVKDYTDRLIQKLISSGGLSSSVRTDLDPETGLPRERQHLEIAVALRDHLRNSGLFAYSYTLRRVDLRADPIEDFLKNTRDGHCERFATALTLMLRSQGIPAQFVLGFKGQESLEDGKFLIRHDNAHAWVEVMLPVTGESTGQLYQWMSLDPTPGVDEINAAARASWWEQTLSRSREFLTNYVVAYDATSRAKVMEKLEENATWQNATVLSTAFLVMLLAIRHVRYSHRTARRQAVRGWNASYAMLLDALQPLGLRPTEGQTPQEFARAVSLRLQESPQWAAVASVPVEWTETQYAVRYGGQRISADRAAQMQRDLDALRQALRQGG